MTLPMTLARRLSIAAVLVCSAFTAFAHSNLDLAASLRVPPFLRAGATERFEAVLEVLAFDPAAAVTFTIEIDNGTFANASAGPQWRCTREAKRVRCVADEAAPGPHVIALDITAPASGSVTVNATVTSIGSSDPVDANNRARATSRIYTPSSCSSAAPVLVNALTTSNVTELTWSAVPGATSYEVYASVDGERPRRIATTSDTRAASRLLAGGEVTWSVRALFADCPAVTSESATFASGGIAPRLRVSTIRFAQFAEPYAVAIHGNAILVADASRHLLFQYEPGSGILFEVPFARETGSPAIQYDGGIAIGPGGVFYVADRANHAVRYAFITDGFLATASGTPATPGANDGTGRAARLRAPLGIAVDAYSRVFVADSGNNTIRRIAFDAAKGDFVTSTIVPASAGLSEPAGIAVDLDGNLIVADHGNHVIRRISPAGAVTTLAGVVGQQGHRDGDAGQALFHQPFGVAVDAWGNIYVSEEGSHTIRRITPNRRVSTVAGTPGVAGDADGLGDAAAFNRPGMMAVDTNGVLWIADRGNATLRRAELGVAAPKRRAARP
jgi:sugar lactone lactonase YvrE